MNLHGNGIEQARHKLDILNIQVTGPKGRQVKPNTLAYTRDLTIKIFQLMLGSFDPSNWKDDELDGFFTSTYAMAEEFTQDEHAAIHVLYGHRTTQSMFHPMTVHSRPDSEDFDIDNRMINIASKRLSTFIDKLGDPYDSKAYHSSVHISEMMHVGIRVDLLRRKDVLTLIVEDHLGKIVAKEEGARGYEFNQLILRTLIDSIDHVRDVYKR